MRAIVFSDIHGNQYAFRAFLEQIQDIDYQLMLYCGDIYGYYYGQDEIVRDMKKLKNLYAVKGNHDEMAARIWTNETVPDNAILKKYGHSYCMLSKEGIDYVRELPDQIQFEIDNRNVLIVHGTPTDALNGRLYPEDSITELEAYQKYDYVICGHTHYRMYRREGNTVILNPGSLGQQRDGLGFGYAIIDFATGECRFCDIQPDIRALEMQIDLYDKDNSKLKDILHRGGH